jgi:hypothetical protein
VTDRSLAYFGAQAPQENEEDMLGERVFSPRDTDADMDAYWGSASAGPLPIETLDEVPWTIQTADTVASEDISGVDQTGADPDPQVDVSSLAYPQHTPPNSAEIGYGRLGAPAPWIPSETAKRDQRIAITIVDKVIAETRALLVQQKISDHGHFETWTFANGAIIVANETTKIVEKHPNGFGFLILASAAGLYMGENQSVGTGNQGIPIPTGTSFVYFPINDNLYVSSAGAALSSAVSLYVVTCYMGGTTL